jgi:hypothetical protein
VLVKAGGRRIVHPDTHEDDPSRVIALALGRAKPTVTPAAHIGCVARLAGLCVLTRVGETGAAFEYSGDEVAVKIGQGPHVPGGVGENARNATDTLDDPGHVVVAFISPGGFVTVVAVVVNLHSPRRGVVPRTGPVGDNVQSVGGCPSTLGQGLDHVVAVVVKGLVTAG